jgi:PAS domain S-box-containing protein
VSAEVGQPWLALVAQRVVELSEECLLVCDHDRRIVAANAVAERVFRAAPGALVGRSVDELVPLEQRGRHAELMQAFASSQSESRAMGGGRRSVAALRLDGTPFSAVAQVYRLSDGAEARLAVSLLDLSDEATLTHAFDERRSVSGAILRRLPVGLVVQVADGRIVLANEAAQAILGLSLDQMLGRTSVDPRWRSIRDDGAPFPGSEHPSMRALRSGAIERDVMGVHKPDGSLTWITIEAGRLGEGPGAPVLASFVDITRAREAEARLTASLARQATLGSLSFDGMVTLRADLTIEAVSGSMGRLLGRPEAQLPGEALVAWALPDEQPQVQRALAQLLAFPGARSAWDMTIRIGSGHLRKFDCRGINLLGDPAVAALVVSLRDLTDQRAAEAALQQAKSQLEQRLAELSRERAADAALVQLAELVQHCEGAEQVSRVVAGSLRALLPGLRTALYVRDGDSDAFFQRGEGAPGPADGVASHSCWALRTRRTHVSQAGSPLRCEHLEGPGVAACLPLSFGGRLFGVVLVSPGDEELPPPDALDRLAGRLSTTLRHARGLT